MGEFLKDSAGKFAIETYTGGSPHWVTLSYGKDSLPARFNSDELYDLQYVVNGLIRRLEQRTKRG